MSDSETLEVRRKRLLYRAEHRGTQEMDILIGGYVADHLETLDIETIERLEALLGHEETDLQAWLLEQRPTPGDVDSELIARIRNHKIGRAQG